MKLPSTRIRKRRAPSRLQSDSHQNTPVPRRRSYRLQSSQRSASIPHILGSYYESQSPLEQRPADPQASQPIGATSNTRVPTPGPIETSTLVPLRAQFQEYLCPPQTCETVQQPKPLPPKRPYASFLEDSVYHLPWSPAPKRYRPDSAVTQWIESISGLESYRESHCRSDTLLGYLDGELTPGRLTKSALNMDYVLDTDGFALPSIPASFYTSSVVPSSTTGSGRKRLVGDPYYRLHNLAENNIHIQDFYDEFPEDIARLVDEVRMDRNSPGPSPDHVRQDRSLRNLEMGTGEPAVENYFKANIFPDPGLLDTLKRIDKNPMAKQAVPDVKSELKVSTPAPDILYGYNRLRAFTDTQLAQLRLMRDEIVTGSQDLIYPFFVIEFKADGPGASSGSLWEATNQCLGGSASCVNITERLNRRLRQCKSNEVQPINSAAFSIAMNGTEARLYISWTQNERDYYLQKVESFLLQRPDHFLEFRKYVRNIIDWAKDKRLNEIRESLDSLEKNRKTASQLARSRPQPSDNRASSSHSRGGRRRNSRDNSVQEHPSSRASYPPSASSQENNQYESFVRTRAADRVYVSPYPSPQENNHDDSSPHVPAADIVYARHDTLTFHPITPPQSTEDTSLPPVSSEDIDDSHVRGRKRTRSKSQNASQETLG